MRVLWITNIPVAKHREMLNLPLNQSGGWIEASYLAFKDRKDIELGIVTTYEKATVLMATDGHHSFYVIPCKGDRAKDISNDPYNQNMWQRVLEDFKPDVIHLWGSEFSHGLCALKVAKNIPSVVYIQGMMSQIAHHYDGGISIIDQIKSTTIRDVVLRLCMWQLTKQQKIRANIEAEILRTSKNVIVENEWCSHNCKVIEPECKAFKSLLPINSIFSRYQWNKDQMTPHTIFTVAGNSPIKGFHKLLESLSIVVRRFPDTKVYVPGNVTRSVQRSSYYKYTNSLIKKYNLEDHILMCGRLTPEQMAEHMSKCNVFVMPSAIENHSSTLIEAMMVGSPSIASFVGGVSDYLKNNINGFMYRFDEPQTLAACIMELFDDIELADKISKNARGETVSARSNIDIVKDFTECYKIVKNDKRN